MKVCNNFTSLSHTLSCLGMDCPPSKWLCRAHSICWSQSYCTDFCQKKRNNCISSPWASSRTGLKVQRMSIHAL